MSFICSSNNNIPRITQILTAVRSTFGSRLCTVEGRDYYSFPGAATLAAVTEEQLRGIGLGYRAKYVHLTAKMIIERGGADWLATLRDKPREVWLELVCVRVM